MVAATAVMAGVNTALQLAPTIAGFGSKVAHGAGGLFKKAQGKAKKQGWQKFWGGLGKVAHGIGSGLTSIFTPKNMETVNNVMDNGIQTYHDIKNPNMPTSDKIKNVINGPQNVYNQYTGGEDKKATFDNTGPGYIAYKKKKF